jgi:hypothetical protein
MLFFFGQDFGDFVAVEVIGFVRFFCSVKFFSSLAGCDGICHMH